MAQRAAGILLAAGIAAASGFAALIGMFWDSASRATTHAAAGRFGAMTQTLGNGRRSA